MFERGGQSMNCGGVVPVEKVHRPSESRHHHGANTRRISDESGHSACLSTTPLIAELCPYALMGMPFYQGVPLRRSIPMTSSCSVAAPISVYPIYLKVLTYYYISRNGLRSNEAVYNQLVRSTVYTLTVAMSEINDDNISIYS